MLEPELAKPNQSEGYDPAVDENWHKELIKHNKPKKISLELLIFIFCIPIFLLGIVAVLLPVNCCVVTDSKWSEAKTVVGAIKAAVDSYRARNGDDISGLDEPKGMLKEGFVEGSGLLVKLKLEDVMFEDLQYFNAKNITLKFVTDGKDGEYIITVDAQGDGGNTGNGPTSGNVIYNSETGQWIENY